MTESVIIHVRKLGLAYLSRFQVAGRTLYVRGYSGFEATARHCAGKILEPETMRMDELGSSFPRSRSYRFTGTLKTHEAQLAGLPCHPNPTTT